MVLAGDVGGTKTNLALYEITKDTLELKVQSQYSSKIFSSLSEIISVFQEENSLATIEMACFGIAGPVLDGRCKTTNLPWDIQTSELQEHLGIGKVSIINDLEATAYGMLYLDEDEFVDLNPSAKPVSGNRAVIAAGTGLGEAILYYDSKKYHPIGSEGGHTDFAPLTEHQDELLQWMRKRYPEHVSYERILSGPGVYTLYEFLLESGYAQQPLAMLNIKDTEDKSAMISKCALNDKDSLCMKTLELFCEVYAAEAGNLALKCVSIGGVYIGGGIAPKILPMLQEKSFMNTFVRKGRFEEMLKAMQVRVSLNQDTALFGAAHFAVDKL